MELKDLEEHLVTLQFMPSTNSGRRSLSRELISSSSTLLSCRNNKKRQNLEYYFISCIFPNVKLKS